MLTGLAMGVPHLPMFLMHVYAAWCSKAGILRFPLATHVRWGKYCYLNQRTDARLRTSIKLHWYSESHQTCRLRANGMGNVLATTYPACKPGVQDVFKPESAKLRRNLSAIINFAKFREEKALAFQELQVCARVHGEVSTCIKGLFVCLALLHVCMGKRAHASRVCLYAWHPCTRPALVLVCRAVASETFLT